MRKMFLTLVVAFAAVALIIGCGQKKESEKADKTPPAVSQAEHMDSTRMDSAMMDTAGSPMEMEHEHDSM
ncbi:MAG: hypothetical protein ACE5FH_08280 [Candidatus Zixiibacteriota bacterium]